MVYAFKYKFKLIFLLILHSSPVLLSFKRQAYIPCFILNLGLWLASSKWKLHVVTSIIICVSCRILGVNAIYAIV